MRTKETENLFDIIQHKIINLDTDHKFKVATNVQYTFTNILSNIVDKDFLSQAIVFYIEIASERNHAVFLTERKKDKKIVWKRYIGTLSCESGKREAYYLIEIDPSVADIDLTFLRCAETVYYEWIVEKISGLVQSEKKAVEVKEAELLEFEQNISTEFQRFMRTIYSIPVEMITAISGIYYEKEECCSNLLFYLEDKKKVNICGVELKSPIKFTSENISKIRKQLQMGNRNQCLLLCQNENPEAAWEVIGLYEVETLLEHGISFTFLRHMAWEMLIGKRLSVCFENGIYLIKSREVTMRKLEEKYKNIFGLAMSLNIKKVCKEAFNQKHGTIVVILKEEDAQREITRLIECSSGTEIKPRILNEGFTGSMTSIDGALRVSKKGKCYGYGLILTSPKEIESFEGEAARGARYNSAKRYIAGCKACGYAAIGIVVSEDGPVTIFSSEDDF